MFWNGRDLRWSWSRSTCSFTVEACGMSIPRGSGPGRTEEQGISPIQAEGARPPCRRGSHPPHFSLGLLGFVVETACLFRSVVLRRLGGDRHHPLDKQGEDQSQDGQGESEGEGLFDAGSQGG